MSATTETPKSPITYYAPMPPAEMQVAQYQRSVNPLRVEGIAKNFRPELLDPPFVSHRDGGFFVVDGRHRQEALIAMGKGNDPVVCQIVDGLTYAQEARLFAERNSPKAQLSVDPNALLKAMLESTDDWSWAYYDTVNSVGLIFPFEDGGHHDNPKCLRAIKTTQKIARLYGFDHLKKVLEVLRDSWEEGSNNYDQRLINGMSLFLRRHDKNVDMKRLVVRLHASSFELLVDTATMNMHNRKISSPEGMVRAIESCYNKHLKDETKFLISPGG